MPYPRRRRRRVRKYRRKPKLRPRKTSVNEGHFHYWSPRLLFTSRNKRHRHKVNKKRRITLPSRKGGHIHKL